jgi:hypothetical protein
MTGDRMDELMIVAISRAAQLAYVEEASGAFAYLSAADRFLRYHASKDRTATLDEELERLADLASIDGSFSLEVGEAAGGGSTFIPRLALIDAALSLAAVPGRDSRIRVETAPGDGTIACVLSRGAARASVQRA